MDDREFLAKSYVLRVAPKIPVTLEMDEQSAGSRTSIYASWMTADGNYYHPLIAEVRNASGALAKAKEWVKRYLIEPESKQSRRSRLAKGPTPPPPIRPR